MKIFAALVYFLFITPAHAAVDQPTLGGPSPQDITAMKNYTVRIVNRLNDGSFQYVCSGVIVNEREVVSAGHCLSGSFSNQKVEFGSAYVEMRDLHAPNKMRRIPVTKGHVLQNSSYDLLSLEVVDYRFPNDHIPPLASAGCDDKTNQISAGFGLTETNREADSLRFVRLNEINDDAERARLLAWSSNRLGGANSRSSPDAVMFHYSNEEIVNVYEQNRPEKACFGDSGGPVFCRSKGRLALNGIMIAVIGSTTKALSQRQESNSDLCRSKIKAASISLVGLVKAIRAWDLRDHGRAFEDSDSSNATH